MLTPDYPVTLTDLYQLTMAAGYHVHNHQQKATFELYVRRLPAHRSFLIAAGLEQALTYLEQLHFTPAQLDYLRQLPAFAQVPETFFSHLAQLRFTGDVWAPPEGTVIFPHEPLLRITAPLIEAQLVETLLLSLVNYQTLVASKAARVWLACQRGERPVGFTDFGTRRAHGPEAGLLASRAAYIGGAIGTANAEAGLRYGIPVFGTAAHAWIMAHDSEAEAFANFQSLFPEHTTLLLDTYDTLEGARQVTRLPVPPQGVRLDSGDFLTLSHEVRQILDEGGCAQTQIVVSGDMNEHKITELLAAGAPIDLFGVGTELVTSLDAPSLGGVYKLVEQRHPDGRCDYKLKLSASKAGYPGAKQVYRHYDAHGQLVSDTLALADEAPISGAEPLLQAVMVNGQRTLPQLPLAELRARTLTQLQSLPLAYQGLEPELPSPVVVSPRLQELLRTLSVMPAAPL
jgi:nicotinate phosphoribosyltransferase